MDPDIINNTAQSEMDKKLAVKFYKKAIFNKFLSAKEGRNIYDDVDYISIIIPGDSTTKIERKATDDDKRRFAVIWERYLKREDDLTNGLPLAFLPSISPAQVENLKGWQIHTVEQLAGLGEKAIQKIPQVRALVDDAKKFLEGNTQTAKLEARIKELEMELAILKENKNEPAHNNTECNGRDGAGGAADNNNRQQRQVRKKVPSAA